MYMLWGMVIIVAGLFMLVCASLRSEFIIYRLLCSRSRILWGENVHRFYLITGAMVIAFGAWMTLGYSSKKGPNEAQDIDSIRAELKEQVDRGKLTKEEAIVRLAQAQVRYGSKKRGQDKKLSPELEAFGSELKGKVAKGEMTDEEAMAAWKKAAKQSKAKSDGVASKDSLKEKE
jgi:hypothetical protein